MTTGKQPIGSRFVTALVAILIVLGARSEPAAAQTPIHEYRFDGNGRDSAGYAHGVVGSEVSFTSADVPGMLGQAAVFGTAPPYDGNDAILVDNAYFTGFGTGDFSIAVWLRQTDLAGRGDIVDANGVAGDGPGFQLQVADTDSLRLRIDDAGGFVRPDSLYKVTDTQWHHVVITVDRDSVTGFKYYVDGAFDSEFDPTSISGDVNPHDDLYFGSVNMNGSFAGQIALFQAFDEALSADQVANLYCTGGDDCNGNGISDTCELQQVTINFDGQPLGPLVSFPFMGYDISPFSGTPDIITVGNPAPGLGDTGMFSSSTTSIRGSEGELFDFVQADYGLAYVSIMFYGYVDGVQTEMQNAPYGSGTLASTFSAPVDELRMSITPELVGDAWVDNIVLKRADDCNDNGVPDVCDTDCNHNGLVDDCEGLADADDDTFPDVCDRCAAGDDTIDSDADGVPDGCDVCPGGDDGLDTDGDGLADGCDPCAGGRGSGDADGDGDLEWDDYARMAPCLEGPNGKTGAGCECFDTDGDGDVDLTDARDIQARFTPARGCYIEGRYFEPGQRNEYPNNCEVCRPNRNITGWSLVASGQVCNPGSGDLCDPTEVCNGTSGRCPDDVVRPTTRRCRGGSGDACDPDEFCTGVSGEACPPDHVAAHTTLCRAAAGACDIDDYCSGVARAACQDVVLPDTTECRAAADVCDVAEFCDGANGECPNDAVRSAAFVCLDKGGTCQEDFKCDGVNTYCPQVVQNKIQGNSCAEARCPDQGVCNTTGTCVCPGVDVCRQAAGICDEPETYNENGGCPTDRLYGSNIACRREWDPFNVSDSACNPPEYCDGQSVDCPPDAKLNVGDVCLASGECDAEYLCHGQCALNPDSGGGPAAPRCVSDAECDTANGYRCYPPPYLPMTCETDANTPPDGTPCDSGNGACYNGECSSLISGQGGPCDGHDFYIIGDPNGFHCDNTVDPDLFCCKSGYIAKDGQTGTCKACCGNHGEDNGGCPQNSTGSKYCCSGQCVDIDTDLSHCGSCSNDCQAIADGSPCLTNPRCGDENNGVVTPGVCLFDNPCGSGMPCTDPCVTCWFYGTCDTCVSQADCDFNTIPSYGNTCGDCNSAADCPSGQSCWSGCGGGYSDGLLCTAPNFCAENPDDCGN